MAKATSNERRSNPMIEQVVDASGLPSSTPTKFTPGYLLIPFGWAMWPVRTMLTRDPTLLSELLGIDQARMHLIAMALAHLDRKVLPELGPILFRAPVRQVVQQYRLELGSDAGCGSIIAENRRSRANRMTKQWRPRPCSCGSGKLWSPQYDARGIFLTYTCEDCHERKMAEFRPDVLTDPLYWADEPIDDD